MPLPAKEQAWGIGNTIVSMVGDTVVSKIDSYEAAVMLAISINPTTKRLLRLSSLRGSRFALCLYWLAI